MLNQCFFTKLYIDQLPPDQDTDRAVRADFAAPFDYLAHPEVRQRAEQWLDQRTLSEEDRPNAVVQEGESSHLPNQGWLTGLEPATAWTTTRSSTN